MGQDMAQWNREEGIRENARMVGVLRGQVDAMVEALRTIVEIAGRPENMDASDAWTRVRQIAEEQRVVAK